MSGKLFNRNFVCMVCTGFFIYSSITMVGPILSRYMNVMSTPETIIGLVSGVFAFSALLVRPVSGLAVDVFNKNKLLIASMLAVACAFAGYAFSDNILTIFFFRVLHGFGWGFGSTVCMTVAIDSLPVNKIVTGIGVYGMAQQLASAFSPSIGIYLSEQIGYRMTFLLAAVIALIAIVTTTLIKTKKPIRKTDHFMNEINFNNIIEKKAVLPALMTLCNTIAVTAIGTFLVIFADNSGIDNIGLYFTVNAMAMIILRVPMSALIDKLGLAKMITVCELFIIAAIVILYYSVNLNHILISAVVMAVGVCGAQPGLMALCVNATTPDRRGVASSTNYIGTDIGNFTGSFLSGVLVSWIGFKGMFLVQAVPVLLVMILYVWYHQKDKNQTGPV